MNGRKVLIIEDNADLREIYKVAFESAGYNVRLSGDGLQGITDVVDAAPDVVLLDIMMPEMSGYDFLEALHRNTSLQVPVVVISNLAQEEDKQKALQAGASLYLVKAEYVGPDLVDEVTTFLDAHPASSPPPAAPVVE